MRSKNAFAILAGALLVAAMLIMSATVSPSAYADTDDDNGKNKSKDKDDKKEKRNEKLERVASILKKLNNDAKTILPSSGTLTVNASGLAVERSNNGRTGVADAKLDMSGSILKVEGSHVRVMFNGTLDIDGQEYEIDAEGKVKLSRSGHGTGLLEIKGRTDDDDDRDKFTLKATILPSSQSREWKIVTTMPTAKLGSHIKIYLIGEMHLSGNTGGGSGGNTQLSHFEISHIANQTAGNQFTFTVKAIDTNGHVKKDYNGTVTIKTNDGSSPMGNASSFAPNPYTFNATADNGQHTFTAKLYNAKSNVTIITVSDSGGKTGTSNKFNVVPAAAASVKVMPVNVTVPSNVTQNFNATAYDAYGNWVDADFTWSLNSTAVGTLTPSATDSSKATFKAAVVSSNISGTITATVAGTMVQSTAKVTVTP